MTRKVPVTMLGVLLLTTLVVGLAGLGIAIASIAAGDKMDFSAAWKLETDHDMKVEVVQDEAVYRATVRGEDPDWERGATLAQVDRFQLAGPLDATVAGSAHAGLPPIATAPDRASLSLVGVNDDTVVVAFHSPGAEYWTDVGTYERGGLWSDPYRFAGLLIFGSFVVMAIATVFEVPVAGGKRTRERPGRAKKALRGAAVALLGVLLVGLLAAQPALARLAFIVLFALWLGYMVKWLPAEVTGTGEFLEYVFSKARRRQIRADVVARDAQAERGTELERTLRGVKQEWSVRPSRPRPAEPGPGDEA